MGVLNSGKDQFISPSDSKLKSGVSDAFKQAKDSSKYSPLKGTDKNSFADIKDNQLFKDTWVKDGGKTAIVPPEGRKKNEYGK